MLSLPKIHQNCQVSLGLNVISVGIMQSSICITPISDWMYFSKKSVILVNVGWYIQIYLLINPLCRFTEKTGSKDDICYLSNETPTWCNTVQVLFLQGHSTCFGLSHHISLLGPKALIRRCDDWPTTITHVPVAAVLVLNTPDDGRLSPKHVEWPWRNKTCTVLHQVGVFIWLILWCTEAQI